MYPKRKMTYQVITTKGTTLFSSTNINKAYTYAIEESLTTGTTIWIYAFSSLGNKVRYGDVAEKLEIKARFMKVR